MRLLARVLVQAIDDRARADVVSSRPSSTSGRNRPYDPAHASEPRTLGRRVGTSVTANVADRQSATSRAPSSSASLAPVPVAALPGGFSWTVQALPPYSWCGLAFDLFGCPFGFMISQIPPLTLNCWQPISPALWLSPVSLSK